MSWARRILAVAVLLAAAYAGASALMASRLTRTRRIRHDDTPGAVGLPFEAVSFPSRSGDVRLTGWLVPPSPRATGAAGHQERRGSGSGQRPSAGSGQRWVVIVHGSGTNRTDPQAGALGLAMELHRLGYGLLLFDLRAHGHSGGERGSCGYYERLDLLGALDFLAERGVDPARTGVVGFSLGAAVALMACGGRGTVGAVVADSAFADLWLMIRGACTGTRRPLALLHPGMSLMAKLLYGIDIGDVSPARCVAASDTPVLIIHGELDELVPTQQARLLARAVGADFRELEEGGRTVWIAPAAGHVQAYRTCPNEYVTRVSEFFDRTLNA